MSLYIELSDSKALEICKLEGWEYLFCYNCGSEISRLRYHQEPAYLAESGDVLCWDCSHCFECGEELLYCTCHNCECELYLKRATNPKKDPTPSAR